MTVDGKPAQIPLGRPEWAWASAVSLLALVLYGWLMLLWKDHGIFAQYNILFDADPNARLSTLAHGWGSDGLIHPLFPFMFSIPIRALVWGLSQVGLVGDPVATREIVATWIAPLASALKVGAVFVAGRAIGASVLGAVGLSLLAGFSFAAALYGALPEHYPLSGVALTLSFVWALAVNQGRVRDRNSVWFGLTAIVAGITITNCAAVLALFLVRRVSQGMNVVRAALLTALLGATAVASVTVVAVIGSKIMPSSETSSAGLTAAVEFTNSYWREPSATEPLRYLAALANTVVAPVPAVIPNTLTERERTAGRSVVDIQFTYLTGSVTWAGWARILIVLAVVAGGAVRGWRNLAYRPLVSAALLVLAFNGVLHIVWGTEWFLYAMHWQPALLFLAAGWLIDGRRSVSLAFLAIGAGLGLLAALVIRQMLLVLQGAL